MTLNNVEKSTPYQPLEDMRQISLDDLLDRRGAEHTSRLSDGEALPGYLMGQIAAGEAEFVEGSTTSPVLNADIRKLAKICEERGGESFAIDVVTPESVSVLAEEIITIRVGRFIIAHRRNLGSVDVWGAKLDYDATGNAEVKAYGDEETAKKTYELRRLTTQAQAPNGAWSDVRPDPLGLQK